VRSPVDVHQEMGKEGAVVIALVRSAVCVVLLTAAISHAEERDGSELYDTPTLKEWQARYTRSMNRILTEGFVPVLSG
jgi:hypothetical protein